MQRLERFCDVERAGPLMFGTLLSKCALRNTSNLGKVVLQHSGYSLASVLCYGVDTLKHKL